MPTRILICEKSGNWAPALRWVRSPGPLRILETRSLLACRDELARRPTSFVALETSVGNLEGVIRLLLEMRDRFPQARAVALADREVTPWEWYLWEAGILQVVFSPRKLDGIVRLAHRHAELTPSKQRTMRETFWSRIPWGDDHEQE